MNSVKLFTIVLIIVLVFSSITTAYFLYLNKNLLVETFFSKGDHNCHPFSYELSAKNSFKSPSKGWCTIGNYDDDKESDDFGSYNRSNEKCPDRHYRVEPQESVKFKSKAWCKRA